MPVVRSLAKIAPVKHAYHYIDSTWDIPLDIEDYETAERKRKRRAQEMRDKYTIQVCRSKNEFYEAVNSQQKEDHRAGMRVICFCMKLTFGSIVDR